MKTAGGARPTCYFNGFTIGDCMGDHDVDLTDLGILSANWGKTGMTWQEGDFSGDGVVALLDLGALMTNWGWTGPGNSCPPQSVPEPACLALLGLAAAALIRRKHKR